MSSLSRKHLPQLSVVSSNIEDIMSRAYDSFEIQLNSLQFLYSKPGTVDNHHMGKGPGCLGPVRVQV